MLDQIVSALGSVVAPLGQLGFAVAAWRVASALKGRVDNHEVRISVVEKTVEVK